MSIKQKVTFISGILLFLCFMECVNTSMAASYDVDYVIKESMIRFEQLSDFTGTLEKKVNKEGVVYYDPEIRVKYKKPSHYYFKWGKGGFEGQEVIFVKGSNNNKLVGHYGGLFSFITLHVDPEGCIAMKRNHHPLTLSGMQKIYDILEDSYNRYKATGEGNIELAGVGMVDNRAVWVIYGEFPKDKNFYAARIYLYIDKEHLLPLKVTVYDWSDALYEEYTFHDLKINVGLNEKDFNHQNDKYNFF
jgi:outer membrane lipoprotein-sorting protein